MYLVIMRVRNVQVRCSGVSIRDVNRQASDPTNIVNHAPPIEFLCCFIRKYVASYILFKTTDGHGDSHHFYLRGINSTSKLIKSNLLVPVKKASERKQGE